MLVKNKQAAQRLTAEYAERIMTATNNYKLVYGGVGALRALCVDGLASLQAMTAGYFRYYAA